MKVLHIVGESKFGGGSIIILQLARHAKSMGWDVDVLTTDATFQAALREAGIGVVALDVIWRSIRPVRDVVGLLRLYRFLKTARYTIVHTHTSKGGFVGRLAARLAGVPIIFHTAHGFAFHERSSRLVIAACSVLERAASRWCRRIFTVSEFHRRWGLRLRIAGGHQIRAIPNGIPQSRVEAAAGRDAVRASLEAGAKEVVVLSTGRLAPLKGIEDLLRAASVLISRGLPLSVCLAGSGPIREGIAALAVELGIAPRVRFLGFRNDVGDLLAASDLVVLPSVREGLSIALLEAMAAGKPIVATAISSNCEATRNGSAALLVPPGDDGALAEAMQKLIADPSLAERLGRTARSVYLASYTEQTMLEKYADEYCAAIRELETRTKNPAFHKAKLYPAAKRVLDVTISGLLLLLLSPLMFLIAAAIRLTSPGPALFRQRRLGRYGVPFTIYKFRTMRAGCADLRNADGSTFNGDRDPRLTAVGRFLRKASLDELPQLINVLAGDLSLVGPRPELPDQFSFYTPAEKRRLDVKPGITGLAQLNGRNSIPWQQRKQLDVEYVEKRSMLLDVKLLLKTAPYVVSRRGIYVSAQPESLAENQPVHSHE